MEMVRAKFWRLLLLPVLLVGCFGAKRVIRQHTLLVVAQRECVVTMHHVLSLLLAGGAAAACQSYADACCYILCFDDADLFTATVVYMMPQVPHLQI